MPDEIAPPLPDPETFSNQQAEEVISLLARIEKLEEKIEAGALGVEAKHRSLIINEIKQRILVRYSSVAIAVGGILFMGVILSHAAHHYFVANHFILVPPLVVVAMFVAPIISITTITIMLLIGAFRRFKDDDMDNIDVSSLASEAIKKLILK